MKFIVEINARDFFDAAGTAVDGPALHRAIEAAVQQGVKLLDATISTRRVEFEQWRKQGARLLKAIERVLDQEEIAVAVQVRHQPSFAIAPPTPPRQPSTGNYSTVKPSMQRILDALAFLEGIGVPMADKGQLALLADAPVTSGGYKNNLGALRTDGYIAYPSPGNVALTDLGREHADFSTVPQTTKELHRAIQGRLPSSKWRLLEALIEAYPDAIGREDLAARVEVPASSGGFKNNLGSLRTLGLIAYPGPGSIAACPILFLESSR